MTTDTGTPGAGHWEINTAEMSETSAPEKLLQIPYFDINYGIGEKVQLKIEGGYGFHNLEESGKRDGVGPLIAGVKWRFYDHNDLTISTYPQVQYHSIISSHDPLIAAKGTNLILPIEVVKQFHAFAINPELGYIKSLNDNSDQMFYGLAVSKEIHPGWEIVGEVFGVTQFQQDGSQILLNIGTRYQMNEHLSFLVSAGHTIKNFNGEPQEFVTYAGVQFRLWKKKKAEPTITQE